MTDDTDDKVETSTERLTDRRVGPRRKSDRDALLRVEARTSNYRDWAVRALVAWGVIATLGVLAMIGFQVRTDSSASQAKTAARKAQFASATANTAVQKANAALAKLKGNVAQGCYRNNEKIRSDDLNFEAEWNSLSSAPPLLRNNDPKLPLAVESLAWIPTTDCAAKVKQQGAKYKFAKPVPFSVRLPTAKDLEVGSD